MLNLKKLFSSMVLFQEPKDDETFILEESEKEDIYGKGGKKGEKQPEPQKKEAQQQTDNQDKKKHEKNGAEGGSETNKKGKAPLRKIVCQTVDEEDDDKENKKENEKDSQGGPEEESEISSNIEDSKEYMKEAYSIPVSGDVVIREFDIIIDKKPVSAFIILIDGMVDRMVINQFILQPLMVLSNMDIKYEEKSLFNIVKKQLLPHNQIKVAKSYRDVLDEVNFGGCGLFVDGLDTAFTADVKGWEHRGIERPNTELVIRGPQEGFNELLRADTALIRKIVKNENLIVENLKVGKRSKTPCSMLYIKDIVNDSLVEEVRKRVNSLRIDSINDTGELEQLLEDNTFVPAPQILATERPDRVASMLEEGKVAIIMQGSPFALVMPTTALTLIHSPEDAYIRFPSAIMLRLVRIIGITTALLLPGLYVAITNFHHEMIPTDLIFAISASREKVPFPSVVEILIMEVSFELIREAGIRIPGPIGPTLGIIGALILGQAAVAANIVSPILIIIVAVTGIGSFSVPNFSLAFSFRLVRFGYIILGAMAGFLGITTGIFIQGIFYAKSKSFGVPFLAPFGPKTAGGIADQILRMPAWMQDSRPDFLNTKKRSKQQKISRGWIKEKEDKRGNE